MRYIGQKLAKNPVKVSEERLYEIIRSPLVSEKTFGLQEKGQYTFAVSKCASKPEIKIAVEKLFNVKVECVNTLLVKGKFSSSRFKGIAGQRSDVKKAIVTLAEGQSLDMEAGA